MNAKPVVVSLLANLGLGLAVGLLLVNRMAGPGGPEHATAAPAVPTTNTAAGVAAPAAAPPRATNAPAKKFDWRMVESADYKKYIANLRAIGCPEETIRDIIVADVNKLFAARRRELTASTNKFVYWKADRNFYAALRSPERLEKLQALDKEKRELLIELLGVAPEEPPNLFANFNPFENVMDFLSDDKQSQVMDIMIKFEGKMMKLYGDNQPDAEDMRKMQQLQKDMEAELQGVMTPEEYRQYQLSMSDTARSMRYQLASFDPNQEEFDKIFDLRKNYDDNYSALSRGEAAQEDRDKAKAARNEMNDQIKALLGDDRYAEYNRSVDTVFQMIYNVTEQNGLSQDVAVQVYNMRKAAQASAKQVREDTSLTPEQRDAALLVIKNETQAAVVAKMGEKAWNAYQPQAGWVNKLGKK